jgi:transposase
MNPSLNSRAAAVTVLENSARVVDAARLLRVSYRQGKRLSKRYREEGAAGAKSRGHS